MEGRQVAVTEITDSSPYTLSVVNRAERQSKPNHPGDLAPSASP